MSWDRHETISEFKRNIRETTDQTLHLYFLPSFMVLTWRIASGLAVKEVPLLRVYEVFERGNADEKGTNHAVQTKGFSRT
jgi:hypothetical protein